MHALVLREEAEILLAEIKGLELESKGEFFHKQKKFLSSHNNFPVDIKFNLQLCTVTLYYRWEIKNLAGNFCDIRYCPLYK